MEEFQNKIKKWVSYDTQLKSLNEKTKEIRNEKIIYQRIYLIL